MALTLKNVMIYLHNKLHNLLMILGYDPDNDKLLKYNYQKSQFKILIFYFDPKNN